MVYKTKVRDVEDLRKQTVKTWNNREYLGLPIIFWWGTELTGTGLTAAIRAGCRRTLPQAVVSRTILGFYFLYLLWFYACKELKMTKMAHTFKLLYMSSEQRTLLWWTSQTNILINLEFLNMWIFFTFWVLLGYFKKPKNLAFKNRNLQPWH